MIILYDSKETNFNNNGIVVLNDCMSAPITEELNSQYELEIEYPLDTRGKWKYLLEGNIIKADGQLFRIYHKASTLTGIKVNARHIFYDLLDNFLEDVKTTGISGYGALDYMLNRTQYPHNFTSSGDIGGNKAKEFLQISPIEAIMGTDGIINTWGGELIRNNFDIKIMGARGLDRGVLVSYGKNIQGIEQTLDMDYLCTRAYPTVTLANNYVLTLPEKYVDSPLINNYPNPKVKGIEFKKEEMLAEDVVNDNLTSLKALAVDYSLMATQKRKEGIASVAVIASVSGDANLVAAEKVKTKNELNKINAEKAGIDTLITKYFKTPTLIYPTVDDLIAAYPYGNANLYIVAEDSKWYGWTGWLWKETPITTELVTAFNTHYNSTNNYIIPKLLVMATTSVIVPEDFKIYFNNYYNARDAILNMVGIKATEVYDTAQADSNLENYIVLLRNLTVSYFTTSKCDLPQVNYKIDFLELSKTEEYKNYQVLERVYLGDTVTIKHTKLNISLKAKVIKTIKNVITNRVENIELGTFKPNLASTTNKAIQEIKKDVALVESSYQKAIDNATNIITGASGGNVVIRSGTNKKPYEILIMDTDDVITATNVWRWNIGGFGFSNTGVNGPFGTAITMDGHIVAEFITALTISGEMIKAGIIQSQNGSWQMNLDNENFNLGDKLMFDGDELTFGSDVTLSWNQITGTEEIPFRSDLIWENIGGVPTDLLTQGELVAALGDYITNGVMTEALRNTLNTTNYATVISKDYIASMNLIVGDEIIMGSNAIISWDNLSTESQANLKGTDGQPGINGIPGTKGDTGANGKTGENGQPGTMGLPGIDGPRGYQGYQGSQGYQGERGYTGYTGSDGEDVDYGTVTTMLSWNYIVTGAVACDRLATPYGHSPIITLFNTASLDGTDGNIRLRCNSNYYIIVSPGQINFYAGESVNTPIRNYISSSIARLNNLSVTGSKNSLQPTKNYGERLINAYETAEYYFGDIGSGKIGDDGECVVAVDEIFQECVNMNIKYHVFTQVYNGAITTIDRQVGYFIVKGEIGTEFSWELKAKRIDYENVRLDFEPIDFGNTQSEIETELETNQKLENTLLEE